MQVAEVAESIRPIRLFRRPDGSITKRAGSGFWRAFCAIRYAGARGSESRKKFSAIMVWVTQAIIAPYL